MTDEPATEPEAIEAAGDEDAPERRRSRSRRSRRVQTKIPFTSLRFSRPRLPTPLQGLMILSTVAALAMGGEAIRISVRAGATLGQASELLAMNTRGAAAGRLAADQLEAQVRGETASVLAAQDAARRAQQASPYGGAPMMPAPTPQPYSSYQESQSAAPTGGFQLPFMGAPPATPYSSSPASQATMGYTLPSGRDPAPGMQTPSSPSETGSAAPRR